MRVVSSLSPKESRVIHLFLHRLLITLRKLRHFPSTIPVGSFTPTLWKRSEDWTFMGFLVTAKICCPNNISRLVREELKSKREHQKLQGGCPASVQCRESLCLRRGFLNCIGASFVAMVVVSDGLSALPAMAEDERSEQDEGEGQGVVGAFKSMFDPNEKTKSGKVLPKAYLKSAREIVKTLRESLKEDPTDIAKFRRTADAAKESIRDYLSNWRGQEGVASEESYKELEKVIRSLATFYSKAGPSAPLPEEVKSKILDDLSRAEEFL